MADVDLFAGRDTIKARALLVGERLQLHSLETTQRLALTPATLTVSAGERGVAVLFRYGAVVLFDVAPLEEASFLHSLEPWIQRKFDQAEVEDLDVRVEAGADEGVLNGVTVIKQGDVERLQVIADILAKSVILSFYEHSVAGAFDTVEPLAASLERKGGRVSSGRALLRHIGRTLAVQHMMVGRVEIEEKPEILWDHPELERLYLRLEDEYELRERHLALGQKLQLISRTAETLLELLQAKRSLRVEWYIVILIVVEILLYVYEMFVRHPLGS